MEIEDSTNQNQFELLTYLISSCIILHSIVVQFPGVGYLRFISYFYTFESPFLGLPVFSSFPNQKIAQFLAEAVPFAIPRLGVCLGALLMYSATTRRMGAFLIFVFLTDIFFYSYPYFGVGDPIFWLFAIIYLIYPGRNTLERRRNRALAIGALGGMYFCSALNKINFEFISGSVFKEDLSLLIKPWLKEIYEPYDLYQVFVILGLVIELLASCVLFVALEWVGLIAATTFHFLNAFQMNWVLSLTILPMLFPFLFGWSEFASKRLFLISLILLVTIHAIGLTLSSSTFRNFIQPTGYELILEGLILISFFTTLVMFRLQFKKHVTALGPTEFRFRIYAFLFCACLALGARFLELPTPFGFTQYSGLTPEKNMNYVLGVHSTKDIMASVFNRFLGRWDVRLFYSDEENGIFTFPRRGMRDSLKRQLCKRDNTLRFSSFDLESHSIPSSTQAWSQNQSAREGIARFKTSNPPVESCP